jgi:hypothetical protein
MTFRCAILDDYQNCALGFADWASLDGVEAKNFTHPITTADELAKQLEGFEIKSLSPAASEGSINGRIEKEKARNRGKRFACRRR